MRTATIALAAALLLVGCGHAAQAAKPAATVDPEVRALRAQLAKARAERDAALARLHAALQRKPGVIRVVVAEPAAAARHHVNSAQPTTQVFSSVTTTSASP